MSFNGKQNYFISDLYPDLSSPNFEDAQEASQTAEPPQPMTEEQKKELQEELEKVNLKCSEIYSQCS